MLPDWAADYQEHIEECLSHQLEDQVLIVERKGVGICVGVGAFKDMAPAWRAELERTGRWPTTGGARVVFFIDRDAESVVPMNMVPFDRERLLS